MFPNPNLMPDMKKTLLIIAIYAMINKPIKIVLEIRIVERE